HLGDICTVLRCFHLGDICTVLTFGGYLYCSDIGLAVSTSGLINIQIYTIAFVNSITFL
ncbi:unnamed protein product, partial [Staurois parvus]